MTLFFSILHNKPENNVNIKVFFFSCHRPPYNIIHTCFQLTTGVNVELDSFYYVNKSIILRLIVEL